MRRLQAARLSTQLVTAGTLIAALVAAVPFAQRVGGDAAFAAIAVLTGALTYAATVLADRIEGRKVLVLILGLAVVLRVYALLFHPFLSTDVYRYVWDGTVQAAGINPYRYVPADPALAQLRDAAIYPNINRANSAVTIYPPVAEFFFLAATRFGASTVVMRLAMLGCEALSVFMMLLMLRHMQQPLTRIVAYAWHPLAIWEIGNGGHVDALMMALTLVGLWAAIVGRAKSGSLRGRSWRAWRNRSPHRLWLPSGGLGTGKFLSSSLQRCWLCYLPYLSVGWGVFGFLPHGYLNEEGLVSGGGYWLLSLWRLAFGARRYDVPCYVVLAAALLLYLALVAAFRRTRTAATTLADANVLFLAVLLLLSPEYPWYYLIVVPFAALLGNGPIWAPTLAPTWAMSVGALLLTAATTSNAHATLIVKSVLFGSALLCWAWSAWSRRQKRPLTVQ